MDRADVPGHHVLRRERDHDRSRSRDVDVTLGADEFDFSRELAQVIDDDRVKAYGKVLRDEFALERNKLRSEAIEHVTEQTQLVVADASRGVDERRAQLEDEWRRCQASSELTVRQVEAQSEFLVSTAESHMHREHQDALKLALSQTHEAYALRDQESRQAYGLLKGHLQLQTERYQSELVLHTQQRSVLQEQLVQAGQHAQIVVDRSELGASVAYAAVRAKLTEEMEVYTQRQQQQQQQQQHWNTSTQQQLDDKRKEYFRCFN